MTISVEKINDNIVITLPASIDPVDLQNGLRYFKFAEISARSAVTDADIQQLAKSVKAAMAKPIIARLKQLDEFKDL